MTSMYGDSDHMRLFLALGDGNIQIFSYDYKAKARVLAMVSTSLCHNFQRFDVFTSSFDSFEKSTIFVGG